MSKTPMVIQVRYILIIFSVIFFSLTVISCKSIDDSVDDLTSSTSSNGLFVTVGDNGIILTSSDGTTWDNRISGTTNNLYGVTYGNSTFVTVGDNGTILTSPKLKQTISMESPTETVSSWWLEGMQPSLLLRMEPLGLKETV